MVDGGEPVGMRRKWSNHRLCANAGGETSDRRNRED